MMNGVGGNSLLADCVTEPGRPPVLRLDQAELGEVCEWLSANRDPLRGVLDVHGALVLPGLPVRSPDDFAAVRDAFFVSRATYREKATPRSNFGNDVYSSTDFPARQTIRPHNENSYTLSFPGLLMFGCLTAPADGGATPVTDVRRVLQQLPESLVSEFRQRGWALVRNYTEVIGLPWATAFGTENKAEVAQYCAGNLVGLDWLADGSLRTVQRRSAIITNPRIGEEIWFNHLVFWSEWSLAAEVRTMMVEEFGSDGLPFNTTFGDGEPVSQADIAAIDDAYTQATVRRSWQPGDLMIVDNLIAAHGREPFAGDRRVVVAMGEAVELTDCRPTVQPLPGFAGR
jgi:hypothetical protein